MQYPPEFMSIVQKISKRLAPRFKFGYHDADDIEQEISILAIEMIKGWDGIRPLENFLSVSIRNRLCNNKRNKYERLEKPCTKCPFYDKKCLKSDSQCTQFSNVEDCELYAAWIKRNSAKKSLANAAPSGLDYDILTDNILVTDNHDNDDNSYFYELIDKFLPADLRKDYVKLRLGSKLNNKRYLLLVETIKQIFIDNGIEFNNDDET